MKGKLTPGTLLLIITVVCSSCAGKKIKYFTDAQNHVTVNSDANIERSALLIKPFDVLDIRIRDRNHALVSFFNPNVTQLENAYLTGFQVRQEGYVELPQVGKLLVENLTLRQAEDLIRAAYEKLIINPIVEVRYLSFRVNVVGEVRSPGIKTLIGESATLLDAILLSGDMTDFGNKSNVKIIRGNLESPQVFEVDLTSIDAFKSRGYYLEPNDIIYIEPVRGKSISKAAPWASVLFSLVSATVTVINILR